MSSENADYDWMPHWLELYQHPSLCDAKEVTAHPTNEEYKCFVLKNGYPVKYGQTRDVIRSLPRDQRYFRFFQRQQNWWMIPCFLWDGTVLGFVLRAIDEKDYITVVPDANAKGIPKSQLLFGLEAFGDFPATGETPIVLTEGGKDQLVIASEYPYTVALLQAKVTRSLSPLLEKITNRLVFAFDSDGVGNRQIKAQMSAFKKAGKDCSILKAPSVGTAKTDWGSLHYMKGTKLLKRQVESATAPRMVQKELF